MADPTSFTLNDGTFTFSNGNNLTIAVATEIVQQPTPSITVDSVTLTFETPSTHDMFILPVDHFVVPVIPPPVEDLLHI